MQGWLGCWLRWAVGSIRGAGRGGWECARVGGLRFGSGLDQTRRGKQEVVVDVSAGAEKGRGGEGPFGGAKWLGVACGALWG